MAALLERREKHARQANCTLANEEIATSTYALARGAKSLPSHPAGNYSILLHRYHFYLFASFIVFRCRILWWSPAIPSCTILYTYTHTLCRQCRGDWSTARGLPPLCMRLPACAWCHGTSRQAAGNTTGRRGGGVRLGSFAAWRNDTESAGCILAYTITTNV